jgi:c-di-GMP-binding flagellar brake protein YcgR
MSPQHQITLALEQAITLEAGSTTIKGVFQQSRNQQWWIHIPEQAIAAFKSERYTSINFDLDGVTYSAPAEILLIQEQAAVVILQEPLRFDSHPVREYQRINTLLEASLIIKGVDDSPDYYIYRDENRILNISLGGMQLACANPLPEHTSDLLVLLGLNTDELSAKENQMYCHGIVSRIDREIADPQFPNVYGIRFKPLAPVYAKMLKQFIEQAL